MPLSRLGVGHPGPAELVALLRRRLHGEFPEDDDGEYATVSVPGMLHVNSVQTYEAAGLAGLGLIQAAYAGIRQHLQSGAMVEVLLQLRPEPLDVSLVVAHRRNLSPRVRAFMKWVEGVLQPYLD